MKQCKFYDIENDMYHGGILLDSGDVICGCCGGIQEKDDEGITWKLEKVYDDWINLSEAIKENHDGT